MNRTTPLSECWGHDRGHPLDRYYIEQFLSSYRADIRGSVLEIKDSSYTDRFGRGVTRKDILDVDQANPHATVIADLAAADIVESDRYDCIILTQTLQYIYDLEGAIAHTHRILRPGGCVLVTVPAVSRLDDENIDYWRFMPELCRRKFAERFNDDLTVVVYGNVLAAIGVLTGLAWEELRKHDLDARDPHFPVMLGVRAVKHA